MSDKLKATQIAYFKRPSHFKQTWQTALWTRILFYTLFAFFFLTKREEKVNVGPSSKEKSRNGDFTMNL